MWILDSISQLQFKRPFFILSITLGAAFMLLATLFSRNALYHPLTYSLLAFGIWLLWQRERSLWNGFIVPAAGLTAFLMVPDYRLLFSFVFALAVGKVVFAENFRIWKLAASSLLFFAGFPIISTWQSIPHITASLPAPLPHLVYAAVLAFCVQFALIPFQIRKDSVLEAYAHYTWKPGSHAHHLVSETVALYTKIKTLIRTKDSNLKIQTDLEDYTERIVHQCHRLQEVTSELSNVSLASLEQQILFLKEKLDSVQDFSTKMQYEQALHNKGKQIEQYEKLKMQQEHLLSCIINYNSSLENVRFAYANQSWQNSSDANENIDMFMELVKARAEAL